MALSATRKEIFPVGNHICAIYDLSFASVTGAALVTGMNNVLFASYSPRTSDNHGIVYPNFSDTGTTAAPGTIYVDSVTANDYGRLMVVGY